MTMVMVMVVVMVSVTPTVRTAATTTVAPTPCEILVLTFIKLLCIIGHRLKTRPSTVMMVVMMVMVIVARTIMPSRMPMMIPIPPTSCAVQLCAFIEMLRLINHCLKIGPTTMMVVVVMVVIVSPMVTPSRMPMMIPIPPTSCAVQLCAFIEVLRPINHCLTELL
jgi:hypothetical protein